MKPTHRNLPDENDRADEDLFDTLDEDLAETSAEMGTTNPARICCG